MTLGDHLDELRRRVIWAFVGLIPIIGVAFYFGLDLLVMMLTPARDALKDAGQSGLVSIEPFEVFSAYMKVSMIAAIVAGSPWIMLQLWRFVAPGLHPHERRYVYFLLPLSTLLTASSVIFLYRVVLPSVLTFLVTFGSNVSLWKPHVGAVPEGTQFPTLPLLADNPPLPAPGAMWINTHEKKLCIATPAPASSPKDAPPIVLTMDLYDGTGVQQQYRVGAVMDVLLLLTAAFAIAFQAPVVVLLLGWVGLVDRALLAKFRRHAILACAIIAAAVMPGDPMSMISLMVPLYLLYELGGILLLFFPASRVRGRRPGGPREEAPE